jgi:hypothetical protein
LSSSKDGLKNWLLVEGERIKGKGKRIKDKRKRLKDKAGKLESREADLAATYPPIPLIF